MAKQNKKKSVTGIYHIMLRSISHREKVRRNEVMIRTKMITSARLCRFAKQRTVRPVPGSPGDEGNAIRHTVWQAIITNEYGEKIANDVAFCHEDNWNVSPQGTIFKNKEIGDTYVDMKNNEIGRLIGRKNPNATNKQLITKVMEHYHSICHGPVPWQPVDNKHGAFGLVDDLYMSYNGNQLTSVRDNSTHSIYAGATDFYTDSSKKEYPLTYNGAGSLVSDAGRKIAKIDYDLNNNPVRIQFTNGNVTKYIYSATGEKLRVTYQTAVPNISVAIGSSRELAPTEILSTDYTDYLLGGSLTLKNGRIDKYQFDEGYCQAEKYIYNTSQDEFTFCYYDKDHLGNVHQVTEPDGTKTGNVIQKINYYPFGAQFCDGSTDSNVQSHKYNGKEFDKMHGLNTYDYGARQYNPITARWDRMDPLCEKYYSVSPYAYCHDNPVNRVDPDGKDDYFNSAGSFMYSTSNGSDVYVNNVLITDVSLNNDASRQAVANVVGYYANEAGISYYVKGGKSVGDSPSGTVGLAYQSNKDTFAFTRGNDIYVNKSGGHINSYLHDKYNIISTFEHEKEHKNNGHGFGGMTNRAHASVYAKHIGSKTFSKTTKDYQNVVVNSFIEMLKKSITVGATDKVIMSLISDANKGLSGTGMQIVYRRTGSDTDSYNLEVVK